MKCTDCPVVGPAACLAETAMTLCPRVAAGDVAWRDRLVEISRLGDPLDFAGNPAYHQPEPQAAPPAAGPTDPGVRAAMAEAVRSGRIADAALSPNLDPAARVDTCPFADLCFCVGVAERSCRHPDRPDRVDRATCVRCQAGEFDRP